MMRSTMCAVALATAAVVSTAAADVHFFVQHPSANLLEYTEYCTSLGLVVDSSVQFSAHPDGEIIPTFFQASSGVTITHDGAASIQTGNGSLDGNTTNPDGIGEGVLVPEPMRYMHTGFGSVMHVDFEFDAPVAGFGLMTADMFQWGPSTPNATFEAFDADGNLLGGTPAVNQSFEFDFLYFMGVVDDAARIKRVRFTNYGVAGDSIYLTYALIARPVTPPCSADFNADGTVNSQDFFDFLSAFFASLPTADFNQDSLINSQDFFDFLSAFFAGC